MSLELGLYYIPYALLAVLKAGCRAGRDMSVSLKPCDDSLVLVRERKMKSIKLGILIAVLATIFLTGEAIYAAESITTKDYWVLRDGYSEVFTNDTAVTVSYRNYAPYFAEDVFLVNYPGPGAQALKYDASGNLIYYGAEYGLHWVYTPDSPQKFLPNFMEIGQSYTSEWSRKEYMDGSFLGYGSDNFSFTISGPHTTTVRAGTFTTYILYVVDNWSTSYGESGTSARIYYLAKGIGWIKMTIDGKSYELLNYSGPPVTPTLRLTTSGITLTASWDATIGATWYNLFYATYPDGSVADPVNMGNKTTLSIDLWEGAAYSVYLQACNSSGCSDYSNIEHFEIASSLNVNPSTVGISASQTSDCIISGGTSPYSASSSDISVATASLSGSTLSVTAVGSGSTTITVKDSASGSATISVTVIGSSLSVSPTSLSVTAGATDNCTISGGTSPYSASSSDISVATPSLSGSTLSVTAVGAGSATITIEDAASGSATISVTVSLPAAVYSPKVPDTGQTKCYDWWGYEITCPTPGERLYGQDGSYTINSPSYTKLDANGNDLSDSATSWTMVRDNVTGLIWEVKTDDETLNDKNDQYSWEGATELFIEMLNSSGFGGYSDWRLPTITELAGILDYSGSAPTIETNYFPKTISAPYWSSTAFTCSNDHQAWYINFEFDNASANYESDSYHVRAVRGAQSDKTFVDNGDGTITDSSTGLMWEQATSNASLLSWTGALYYCEDLTLAGYTDWRLPNMKELRTIVDHKTCNPAIDTEYFPDTMLSDYWSSTSRAISPSFAWGIEFASGQDRAYVKNDSSYVRAVRNVTDSSSGN